jgi:proline dehydrogenase
MGNMEPEITSDRPEPEPEKSFDLSNTEIAFKEKTDEALIKTYRLFSMMNQASLVKWGSKFGYYAIRWRLPFADWVVKKTIFPQFCGGENLLDCQNVIDELYDYNVLTVLDYGAEGKSGEENLDATMEETLRAVEMAASNDSVPMISTKITGLVDHKILHKLHHGEVLTEGEQRGFEHLRERIDEICSRAASHNVGIFIDAEESWMQNPIDALATEMMEKYNTSQAIVYNTYQMYKTSSLPNLKKDHQRALEKGYILGAKLVRGAYMDKERARAAEMGYPSPIHPDKEATDNAFNEGISYCVEHYETIASCCASHNEFSNTNQAVLMSKYQIDKDHKHLNFCQLFGMSDNITFNLANAGYNVAKYVVYGPIKEVIPYLIRRTEENSSVTGEMSRELKYISKEIKRRGL